MRGDLGALTEAMRELAERVDRDGVAGADPAAIEGLIREIAERPVEVDTRPIEAMLREFGERFGSRATPVSIDTAPIEHILGDMNAKLDAVAGASLDPRPLEQRSANCMRSWIFATRRASTPNWWSRPPTFWPSASTRAAARGSTPRRSSTKFRKFSAGLIRWARDRGSELGLERMVGELLDELEATREAVKAARQAPRVEGPAAGDMTELLTPRKSRGPLSSGRLADAGDSRKARSIVFRASRRRPRPRETLRTRCARPRIPAPGRAARPEGRLGTPSTRRCAAFRTGRRARP